MDSKAHNHKFYEIHGDDSALLRSLIASGNEPGVVEFLCNRHVSVNTSLLTNSAQRTYPLHVAVDVSGEVYHNDIVQYFLSEGADCNILDSQRGYSPLHYAAMHNNTLAVKTLLNAGAHANLQTDPPLPPLKEGAFVCYPKRQRKQMIRKRKAQLRSYPLHLALRTNKVLDDDPLVQSLDGKSSSLSKIDITRILLSHGADCNVYDGSGFAPLHYAVILNNTCLVGILLDAGADINSPCQEEDLERPIFLAKDLSMLNFLLSRDANPETLSRDGRSILDWSIVKGRRNLTRYVVADMPLLLHKKNDSDQSPLAVAVNYFICCLYYNDIRLKSNEEVHQMEDIIKLMIRAGCDPTAEVSKLKSRNCHKHLLNTKPKFRQLVNTMDSVASSPRTLQDLCTVKIRNSLKLNVFKAVVSLPLPTKLKETLTLSHSSSNI